MDVTRTDQHLVLQCCSKKVRGMSTTNPDPRSGQLTGNAGPSEGHAIPRATGETLSSKQSERTRIRAPIAVRRELQFITSDVVVVADTGISRVWREHSDNAEHVRQRAESDEHEYRSQETGVDPGLPELLGTWKCGINGDQCLFDRSVVPDCD
jgi:hypothetical protein